MKTFNRNAVVLAGSATLAVALLLAMPLRAAANGTDILHFTVSTSMTNNGVEPGADGAVMASQKKQGHADNQKLDIAVTGLNTNTAYELVAAIDSDTNLVDVTPFTTDGKGDAMLVYTSLGNGHGGGKNHNALPSSLNPVSLIREVDIVNSNAQAVLTADLSMPDRLDYLIKRSLSNGGVNGSLMIQANPNQTHFRLFSTGLAANADYLLVFNGEAVQTNTSSSTGRLNISTLVETPPFILDVRSVELWDTSSNVVLQTELP
ncbi:MAG TPA: hypothetical protein VGI63_05490 [Verrucomicrobiae bacterium]|jgi:hypothetical protein